MKLQGGALCFARVGKSLVTMFIVWGPSYMVSGTRDSPPPKATLSSVYMWKYSLCRPSQSTPCMIIHNRSLNNQMYRYSPFFRFPSGIRSQWVLPSQFWPLWYEFLLQILNSDITWHSTLRELSRLGEPKRLYKEKLPRLSGLPYPARRDNSPTQVVSPPETDLQT